MNRYYILANGDKRKVWHWGERCFAWNLDADYKTYPEWSYSSLRSAKRRQVEIRRNNPELDVDIFTEAEFDKKWSKE